MLYLNSGHIEKIGTEWDELTNLIVSAVNLIGENDYAQPLKPYLKYGDVRNRFIAMPAYIGGDNSAAGIKWIASFPGNIGKSIPRAHSITVLNKPDTGIPVCLINSTTVSEIRTASVSGAIIKEYMKGRREDEKLNVGIVGFGPIGQMHLRMAENVLRGRIGRVSLFDLKKIHKADIQSEIPDKIMIADTWEECYSPSDIFITCTVSANAYIDKPPKKGSLQLNVSLTDYKPFLRSFMDFVVVDDWEEVCRHNTDIENMYKTEGLTKENTLSIVEVICKDGLGGRQPDDVVMFNPMGLAAFDIIIGEYYNRKAVRMMAGILLPD